MKKFSEKILIPLFVALLSAIGSLIFQSYRDNNENRLRYFDKWTDITQYNIKEAALKKAGIKLLYNDAPLYNYSTIKIQLYNYTGRDYDHVPVYIEITPQDGDSLKMLNAEVLDKNGLTDGIKKLKDTNTLTNGALKFGYSIQAANRAANSGELAFNGTFLIASNKKPIVTVYMVKKSLDFRDWQQADFDVTNTPLYLSTTAYIIYIILFLIIYIFIIVKISESVEKRRNKKLQEYLRKELTDKIAKGEITLDTEALFTQYQNIIDNFNYENASSFTKFLYKMKKPINK